MQAFIRPIASIRRSALSQLSCQIRRVNRKLELSMRRSMAFALSLLPSYSLAHDYAVGDLAIAHPIAFETAATARAGAGYMAITNDGKTDDRLVAVDADFPRVMLHETRTEGDIATMVHLDEIIIPAGETVVFEPGGKHVMFMGLGEPFELGDDIPATLTFENAGAVGVVFKVEARPESGTDTDHSHH